jgi:CDGSH-type Zn-finger protein
MASSSDEDKETKTAIEVSKNGPYILRNLERLRNSKGVFIETSPTIALCRCGSSGNKPFCDGTHAKIGFKGDKKSDRIPDHSDKYEGKDITIHDNRGVCSHIGHCTDNVPGVFHMDKEPWIDPDGANSDFTAGVIRMCPSGALSYSKDGILVKEYPHEPEIFVGHNRSYHVVGEIELKDPDGNVPETPDHYTLCRCGHSKNKPFCDGTHWHVKFEDEKN